MVSRNVNTSIFFETCMKFHVFAGVEYFLCDIMNPLSYRTVYEYGHEQQSHYSTVCVGSPMAMGDAPTVARESWMTFPPPCPQTLTLAWKWGIY